MESGNKSNLVATAAPINVAPHDHPVVSCKKTTASCTCVWAVASAVHKLEGSEAVDGAAPAAVRGIAAGTAGLKATYLRDGRQLRPSRGNILDIMFKITECDRLPEAAP